MSVMEAINSNFSATLLRNYKVGKEMPLSVAIVEEDKLNPSPKMRGMSKRYSSYKVLKKE